MAKPEWGTKRVCLTCGARFYDLMRSPINCPNCGAAVDLETVSRIRRARPAPIADDAETVAAVDENEELDGAAEAIEGDEDEAEEDVAVEDETVLDETAEDEEDEAPIIEDTTDLGEDEDVSDVIDEDIEEDPDEPR